MDFSGALFAPNSSRARTGDIHELAQQLIAAGIFAMAFTATPALLNPAAAQRRAYAAFNASNYDRPIRSPCSPTKAAWMPRRW